MYLCGISTRFQMLSPSKRYVIYALLTRPPLSPKAPFDLHVLSIPPAFVLSQDQTLHYKNHTHVIFFENSISLCGYYFISRNYCLKLF